MVKVRSDNHMTVKTYQSNSLFKKAFTLIEIMIFVALLSMVLVVAVSYVTKLLMNMKVNEHKIYATFYVEEINEWLYSERNADWQLFHSKARTGPNDITYCFNNNLRLNNTFDILDPSYTTPGITRPYVVTDINQQCPFTGIDGNNPLIFRRTIRLHKDSSNNPTEVTATIDVSWNDNNVTYNHHLENVYRER